MRRVLVVLCIIGATCVSTAAPAHASGEWFQFYKNWSDRTSSTLYVWLGAIPNQTLQQSWRAGSGMNTNECDVSLNQSDPGGWLPSGSYTMISPYYSWSWGGTDVKGPVLVLPNKKCNDGSTWRTELFAHSSYPWSSSHYSSFGCVKVSNTGGPSSATGHIAEVVYWRAAGASNSFQVT